MCFSGTDLTGANLSGADLTGADFDHTDLTGADLSRAYLSGANLNYPDLTRANFNDALLVKASLNNALFDATSMVGSDLSGAEVYFIRSLRTASGPRVAPHKKMVEFTDTNLHQVIWTSTHWTPPNGWVEHRFGYLIIAWTTAMGKVHSLGLDEDLMKMHYDTHPELSFDQMRHLGVSLSSNSH